MISKDVFGFVYFLRQFDVLLIRWQLVITFWSHWRNELFEPNQTFINFRLVFSMTFMVLYLGTYCLKVKGLIYKQLMFMPLTFKQVYHHLTSKVTLSTGAVENGIKFLLKKQSENFYPVKSNFLGLVWTPLHTLDYQINKQHEIRVGELYNKWHMVMFW